jgi:hypothetical protein
MIEIVTILPPRRHGREAQVRQIVHNRIMRDRKTEAQILALDDEQAIRALDMIVEHEYREDLAAALGDWSALEPELSSALAQADVTEFAPNTGASVGDGDLARAALVYVVQSGDVDASVVNRAIKLSESATERFDPATIATGVLVLVVLKTEVKFERQSNGHWRFLIHKRPMSDSTLGHLLTTFIGRFLGGPK